VVRLSYPPDKRFRVELEPRPLVEEHQYFTAAGHLTAIFWTDSDRAPYNLRIIAVDAFCATLTPVTFNLASDRRDALLGE
jgi:hypothetical protein